ncbi:MAG: nucleoside recognition protein [Bacteroidales bacterium]|nr:nucleoside recognition protein [Bacteroidaceae bacterium]MBR4219389.1 nucleoside recognition protein [Bacteroidales bacterium]
MSFFTLRFRRHSVRFLRAMHRAIPKGWKTTLWLLEIMLPISLAVMLLRYFGVIDFLAIYLDPVFRHIGLPGSSSVVFLTGAFVTTYAGIAAMLSFALTLRQATILALMMCLCHALPMECAVTHRTGSSFFGMMVLRLFMAFVCAFLLNLILPAYSESFGMVQDGVEATSLGEVLLDWLNASWRMALLVFTIVYLLMVVQSLLEEYDLIRPLSLPLRPLMSLFGLPRDAAYLWLVGNVLGISYGAAVMFDLINSGKITKEEANEVNFHLAMNHSLIEDTSVFAAIGIGVGWIVGVRLFFALVVVWSRRLCRRCISVVSNG